MATSKIQYPQTHPGGDGWMLPWDLHFGPNRSAGGQEPSGYCPATHPAMLFGKNHFPLVGGPFAYTAGHWTTTTTGTGAAIAGATTAGGGLLLTCGSSSTFNTNLQSLAIWTPVASKRVVVLARIQTSDITTVGFELNIGNSQVDPGTTNYTDVIGVKMAVGAGTIVGKVRGDSGTQSASATLYTAVAATEFFCGFQFMLNATAGNVDGGFFFGSDITQPTYTAFSSAQQTQAAAILTTPPSMYLNLHAKGSAANPTVTFTSVLAHVDA